MSVIAGPLTYVLASLIAGEHTHTLAYNVALIIVIITIIRLLLKKIGLLVFTAYI